MLNGTNHACTRFILPFILVAALVSQSFAGSVKGRVFDRKSGDALPGANIIILGTTLGAATGIDGRYDVKNLPEGKIRIKASYIGYVSATIDRAVQGDSTLVCDFGLTAQALTGEEVVVMAQAQGQNAAINQQLASNTISNIVSSARIKELPDVNAAESVGRLPGVAINRSNGEASSVVIRGLSAKYNTITVNGVPLPATGGDDRTIDLSLISSNILDGIEVKKANTPDMEASALGGTVDLKLREAPADQQVNLSAQGGYNQMLKYYGNYAFTGNGSKRFLDDDLGVIVSFNADRYNRSADKFSGTYGKNQVAATLPSTQAATLTDENLLRSRLGGSLLADYHIPFGKATLNGFYNRLGSNITDRIDNPTIEHNSHYYNFTKDDPKTNIFTITLGSTQDFGPVAYDLSLSRSGSSSDDGNRRTWAFAQENSAFQPVSYYEPPLNIPKFELVDSNRTLFQSAFIYNIRTWEYKNSAQLNVHVPLKINDDINGTIKLGGTYRWLTRANDETQWGRDGLQYGGSTGVNAPLTAAMTKLAQQYPGLFNWQQDSVLARNNFGMPLPRFLDWYYNRSNFLGGNWPQGMVANFDLLNKFTDALSSTAEWKQYANGSLGRDYAGVERYQAGYIMGEFDFFGKFATLIPGVRYERYYTAYHGEVFRDIKVSNVEAPPVDLNYLYVERQNDYWLPMVHLIVNPTDWLKFRAARTETLTQPDYIMYAPITTMNSDNNYCRAANSLLKPAHSKNWDLSVSVYDNNIGLFTLSGFYKDVYDLILQTTINYTQPQGSDDPGYPLPAGLNIPANWLASNSFQIDTYTNNAARAIYKGYEIEWQTHFWYLPGILQGLVLNVNYTHIWSQTYKDQYMVVSTDSLIGHHRPPLYMKNLVSYSTLQRMPDQPKETANISFGYDIDGFSARVVFLYQTDRTSFISTEPGLNTYVAAYRRWDLTLQQKLGYGLQVYANFNNLNNRHDETYRGYDMNYPSYLEYYGFTMDVGVRWSM